MTPVLMTERLRLRPPQLSDAPRIADLLNNFAVSGNLVAVPYPYLESDAAAFLTKVSNDTGIVEFAIELPNHGMIGQIGFHDARLGYYLGQPYWGRGLVSEAVGAALDWFFSSSDKTVVPSGYFAFNKASAAVQRKYGFVETGQSMMHCLARNEQVRHIDTQLTRTAWNGTRQ